MGALAEKLDRLLVSHDHVSSSQKLDLLCLEKPGIGADLRGQVFEMAAHLYDAPETAACRWDPIAERLLTEMWAASWDDDLARFHRVTRAYHQQLMDKMALHYGLVVKP